MPSPRARPSADSGSASSEAITEATPPSAASSAALILLDMPPRPSVDPAPRRARRASAPSAITSAPGCASTPSTEVSRSSWRARRRTAICAARASLSPKVISSVAVASFSFRIGIAPSANSARRAFRTFTYARRSAISAAVIRTWAAWTPNGAKASCHARCSAAWPRADAAWSRGSVRRRGSSPARRAPSAIAPDETTQIGVPSRRLRASSPATSRNACRRGLPRASTTRAEPSFATMGAVTGAGCRRRRRGTAGARDRGR